MLMNQEILERANWQQCPFCRGKIVLDFESGENICNACGLVVREDLALTRSEVGEFSSKRDHLSIAPLNHVGQTFIDRRNVDSRGKKIETPDNMYMMRRLDFQASADNSDRSFKRAMQEITRITERLGIGNTVQREALSIYEKASNKGLIRGKIGGRDLHGCYLRRMPEALRPKIITRHHRGRLARR